MPSLSTTKTLLCVWHTYTQRYTAHSWTNRLTYPYKCILTPPALCSQQLSVLHWLIHWYQKITFHNVFSFRKLLTCTKCICSLDAIILSSSCETQIILIEIVYINKTHTKHLEKDNIGKRGRGGVGQTMSLDAFEFLFLDSAREASNDVNTFLNLRFIKKQKPAGFFWEKLKYKVLY